MNLFIQLRASRIFKSKISSCEIMTMTYTHLIRRQGGCAFQQMLQFKVFHKKVTWFRTARERRIPDDSSRFAYTYSSGILTDLFEEESPLEKPRVSCGIFRKRIGSHATIAWLFSEIGFCTSARDLWPILNTWIHTACYFIYMNICWYQFTDA